MNRAVFLDKDGTLVKDVPYNIAPEKIELEDGVAEGLMELKGMGYKLVIISNQAGVAKGYFGEDQLQDVYRHLQHITTGSFNGFYYCPHHPEGTIAKYAIACNCRKPGSELFFNASSELNIDLRQSWMVGDILNDVEAGNKAGCKTILIDNDNETEWELHRERIPDYVAHNFLEAVASIKHIAKCESIMYEGKLASL